MSKHSDPSNLIPNRQQLLNELQYLARQAGEAIMAVYCGDRASKTKRDGSPVTIADQQAEDIILNGLAKIAPDITIVSEENVESHKLAPPSVFFLVDPLDGTREFIKQDDKGAFTVNIALIENNLPTLGVVYAPALDRMFAGDIHEGAFENGKPVRARAEPKEGSVALISVSHLDEGTKDWLSKNPKCTPQSIGSSLKFCLLACGEADIYPRFGPTMEWDTAAGHAILVAAGGEMTCPEKAAFKYGKATFKNGAFIAKGCKGT